MNVTRAGILLLGFVTACHVTGLLLFCKGFLLKRVVISQYSTCTRPASANETAAPVSSCNEYPRKFKRVVWLLVDALRYDFAVFDPDIPEPVPVYRNKLTFIRDVLSDRPRNAKLFRCVADPPTTTMQRLKAITTGSLPTFVDVSSNFNSYEILEDSLLYQARANGRNVTFMGDDTWLGLYPQMLTKAYDYPSLNVKDLDTVDNGVMTHIVRELEAKDADFVIGHFLGVDHVGHTYGPSHPTMPKKLLEINEFLKIILTAVDEDTIVFVFGDHGMTQTGDHGGETELETNAALLIYTPRPIFDPTEPSGRIISQIDIVPTVAMTLGLPIPFSNLGLIIPEVFLPFTDNKSPPVEDAYPEHAHGYSGRVTEEFVAGLRTNARQIERYLSTYIQHSDDFPSDVYKSLRNKLAAAHKSLENNGDIELNKQVSLTRAASAYIDYIRSVKAMCQRVWAKFDDYSIFKGLVILILSISLTPVALLNMSLAICSLRKAIFAGCTVGSGIGIALMVLYPPQLELSLNALISVAIPLTFSSLLSSMVLFLGHMRQEITVRLSTLLKAPATQISFPVLWIITAVIVLLFSVSLLSNSFILYEGDMVNFFLQSMLICFMFRRLKRDVYSSDNKNLYSRVGHTLFLFLVLMGCVRFTKLFHTCRDLQVGCEVATFFTMAVSTVTESFGMLLHGRLLISCVCVCVCSIGLVFYVSKPRNSRFLSKPVLNAVQYGLPAATVLVCGYWIILALSPDNVMSGWLQIILPRLVFLLCGTIIAVVVFWPFKKESRALTIEGNDQSQLKIDPQQVANVAKRETACKNTTVPPSHVSVSHRVAVPLLVLLVSVWLSAVLVLNDAFALSAAIMLVQVAFFIVALEGHEEGISFPVVVTWGLMCSQYFFGLGHHATITSLRFEAAFVALHGDITWYNLPIAAALVGLNMLASQVLFGLGLPLIVLLVGVRTSCNNSSILSKPLVAGLQYIAFHSVKLMLSVLGASLHRRHLMIWGVFSPRFLYESAFQLTTDLSVILAFLFLRRLEQ